MTRVLIVEDEQYFADPLVSVLREKTFSPTPR
jgi:hypothetical protein